MAKESLENADKGVYLIQEWSRRGRAGSLGPDLGRRPLPGLPGSSSANKCHDFNIKWSVVAAASSGVVRLGKTRGLAKDSTVTTSRGRRGTLCPTVAARLPPQEEFRVAIFWSVRSISCS